jgi:hypothetical protein
VDVSAPSTLEKELIQFLELCVISGILNQGCSPETQQPNLPQNTASLFLINACITVLEVEAKATASELR